MMRMCLKHLLCGVVYAALGAAVSAEPFVALQDPRPKPPADQQPTSAIDLASISLTITQVNGNVQHRASAQQTWAAVKADMKLDARGQFRLAPGASVRYMTDGGDEVVVTKVGVSAVIDAIMTARQPKTPLEIVITGVSGIVQVRSADDQPWESAQVGTMLSEGATFRTGPRSAVQFRIGRSQIITVDRLGEVTVVDAMRQGEKLKTNITMPYGRTRYQVEAAGEEHDTQIHTPSSTLAVRGTFGTVEDMAGFPAYLSAEDGQVVAVFDDQPRLATAFSGPGREGQVDAETPLPTRYLIEQGTVDPRIALARAIDSERQLVANQPVLGGNDFAEQGILTQQQFAARRAAYAAFIPDKVLDLGAHWFGVPFADVNFTVLAPNEVPVTLGSPPGPGRGVHLGNQIANASGVGMEFIRFPQGFGEGVYELRAVWVNPDSVGTVHVEFRGAVNQNPLPDLMPPVQGVLTQNNPQFNTFIFVGQPQDEPSP